MLPKNPLLKEATNPIGRLAAADVVVEVVRGVRVAHVLLTSHLSLIITHVLGTYSANPTFVCIE